MRLSKILVGVTTLIVGLLVAATQASAAVSITITGNGSDSDSQVVLENSTSAYVSQVSETEVENSINLESNTGYNDANNNTGADVSISTGSIGEVVEIANVGGENTASDDCDCPRSDVDISVTISGNGSDSDNNVEITVSDSRVRMQANLSSFRSRVRASRSTGDNRARRNTGGLVEVETGDIFSDIVIENLGSTNES